MDPVGVGGAGHGGALLPRHRPGTHGGRAAEVIEPRHLGVGIGLGGGDAVPVGQDVVSGPVQDGGLGGRPPGDPTADHVSLQHGDVTAPPDEDVGQRETGDACAHDGHLHPALPADRLELRRHRFEPRGPGHRRRPQRLAEVPLLCLHGAPLPGPLLSWPGASREPYPLRARSWDDAAVAGHGQWTAGWPRSSRALWARRLGWAWWAMPPVGRRWLATTPTGGRDGRAGLVDR